MKKNILLFLLSTCLLINCTKEVTIDDMSIDMGVEDLFNKEDIEPSKDPVDMASNDLNSVDMYYPYRVDLQVFGVWYRSKFHTEFCEPDLDTFSSKCCLDIFKLNGGALMGPYIKISCVDYKEVEREFNVPSYFDCLQ